MSDKWCIIADVLDQAPEFQSDSIAGVIPAEAIEREITRATLYVRVKVAGRYSLTMIEAGLTADTLQSIKDITAVKAAYFLIASHNLGTNADKRLAALQQKLDEGYDNIANGGLYYNDGSLVPTRNAPIAVSLANSIPTSLGELYKDGDRYAQPT